MLLVIDPSGGARRARAAIEWAARASARLRLLHLFDARPGTSGLPSLRMWGPTGWRSAPLLPDDALETERERARRDLERLAEAALAAGVPVEREAVAGDVVDEVAERATACDLVALPAGEGRDGDALADAAQALARRLDVPLWTGALDAARAGPVIVDFDGTRESWRAARVAAELAAREGRGVLAVAPSTEGDPLARVAALEAYLDAHGVAREAVVAGGGREQTLAAIARARDAWAVAIGLSARFHLGELLHPTHLEVFTKTAIPLVLCPR